MKDGNTEHEMLTRRVVLTGGFGCALTLLIPQQVLRAGETRHGHADTCSADSGDAELYVFRGKSANRTVIAATWNALHDQGSNVRVHAGDESWAVKMPDASSRTVYSNERGCQIYAGEILNRSVGQGARLKAVVIEVSNERLLGNGPRTVWAERISPQGHRWRIGSPFMSKLIVGNASAAKLYHASSPTQDGEELTRLVAEVITTNVSARGYAGNARHYARRVAAIITPDALRFDPQLPVGFTFAAQNGRHPDDDAPSVVDSVLNGSLAPQVSKARCALSDEFPYFVRPLQA